METSRYQIPKSDTTHSGLNKVANLVMFDYYMPNIDLALMSLVGLFGYENFGLLSTSLAHLFPPDHFDLIPLAKGLSLQQ
jgi:hypothetical protein